MKRTLFASALFFSLLAAMFVGRGTTQAATVVVDPGNMGVWGFFVETSSASGAMVTGPATPPLGIGSANLKLLNGTGRMILGTFAYAGTEFADIDDIEYSTYQNTTPQAISLQFDADYNLADFDNSFQGRLVFEPYYSATVLTGTWQTWDPMAGVWWATGGLGLGSCPQATPCSWATVISTWPTAGVRNAGPNTGATILKAGGPGPAGFDGNVDALTISVSGSPTTYDFEPPPPPCTTDCYVRPDGNDANAGSADTPALAKLTIQAAVNQVSPGGTVHIAAGTYDENVIVNKDITIDGAGQGSTIVRPALSAPTCGGGSLCPGHSSVFLIQSSGVEISDLQVDGDNTSLVSGVVAGGADLDARNGIIEDFNSGVYNDLHVHDVTVENIYLRGIYASSGGTGFIIEDNTVTNVQGDPASIAIFNFGGSGTISGNNVTDANDAIASNWSTGTTYSNNTVTSSGSGVHSDNNGGFGGVADLLEDNTVTNCDAGGYGVWTFAPYLDITVRENTVTNCEVGLAASGRNGGVPVTTSFIDNDVDGQNLAGSTGAYVTTDRFGFGDTDVHASFTGNKIRNNALGFQIDANIGFAANVTAHRNDLSGNTAGALTGGTGGTVNADLRINWWGSDTGPSHVLNPLGTGTSVSDGIIYSPWLGFGTDSAPAIGFQIASPMTWVVGPDVCDATCIQAAIDFSADGDTVKVKEGLFPEQIVINKDITVINGSLPIIDGGGSGDVVTITADGATLDGFEVRNGPNGVVLDVGADNVTVQNNEVHTFTSAGIRGKGGTGANINNNTVTGPHTGSCVGGFWGIFVLNTSGDIDNNTVSGIGNGLTTGCQEGRAIEAQGAGTLAITSNDVSQYQKSGIIVRGTVNSVIDDNTTTGEGPTAAIAMNGITVVSTGTTSITGNHTSGHRYTPEPTFSCGILYVPFGPTTNAAIIDCNDSTSDEVGICLSDAFAGGAVSGVDVTNNTIDAHTQRGIDVDGMTDVLVDDNDIDGQGQGTTANGGTTPDDDTRYYGIFVVDSTGVVSNNDITGIKHGLANGTQSGNGIRASARSGGATDIDLATNVITDIQKNGITVTSPYGGTVNADITGNNVSGNGPISYIAQNGIQLSTGATGTIAGNIIQDYDYTPDTFAATGVLVINAGSTTVTGNIIDDAMEGIYIQNSTVPTVSGNIVTDSRDAAIFAVIQSAGTYSGNTATGSKHGLYVADSSNLSLTGNILLNNTATGLIIDGASANNTATLNRIQFNVRGVDIQPYFGPSPTGTLVNNNCIAGNTTAGMRVDPAVGTVNAENNWWGRILGPNPPGSGDVIDNAVTVDAIPFLVAPVAGCPVPTDGDGDGVPDTQDNCLFVLNPGQENTNGEILPLPKPIPVYNDHTNPAHDVEGDACDADIDGDGVANGTETGLGLSPYVWDTDGDRTNDGTELNCGSNPLVAASNLSGPDTDSDKLPNACEIVYGTNPAAVDTDGDGVLDGTEVKYWMSNPFVTNTDGDNCADKREMASFNGDRAVNSLDQLALAQFFGLLSPEYRPLDTNGDGFINSADQLFLAQAYGLCAP